MNLGRFETGRNRNRDRFRSGFLTLTVTDGGEKGIQIREQRGEARKERVGTGGRVKESAVTK